MSFDKIRTNPGGAAVRAGVYALVGAWTLIVVYPLVFLLQNSFKSRSEFVRGTVWTLPESLNPANYGEVFAAGFLQYFFNSLVVVATSLVILALAGGLAAYALSRITFIGRAALYLIFVGGMTIPVHVTLVPVFSLTRLIGIYDTLLALIGPFVSFNLPVTVFIFHAFMLDLPRSVEEAAFMDGASRWLIFRRIAFPMTRPAVVAVTILNAVILWNEFIFPLVLINSPRLRPLTLALWDFQGQYATNIPVTMAALLLTALPIWIAYAIAREQLIEGIVLGAVKG